jgi:hypothetical protein
MSVFSVNSGKNEVTGLVDNGTLAFVVINARDLKYSKESGGSYVDLELTVDGGPFHGKKLWDIIMSPFDERNSDTARQMGISAITRIFECGGIFDPDNPASYEVFNGSNGTIENVGATLDGLRVAVRIKIEKGKNGYQDKNKVGEWLSPNPLSGAHVNYAKLITGAQLEQARSGAFAHAMPPGFAVGGQPGLPPQAAQVVAPVGALPPSAGVAAGVIVKPAGGAGAPPWLTKPN